MSADKEQNQQEGASSSATKQAPPPTWLSWSIRGASLVLIVGLLGYFSFMATQPDTRPTITFVVEKFDIEQRGTGWAVPVRVKNTGSMSVHALKVKGALTQVPGEPEETADIPLLGPREEVSVTLWFDEDPRRKRVEMSVGSYLLP